MRLSNEVKAMGTLVGGLGTALAIYWMATNRRQELYASAIGIALMGAVLGAAHVLETGESRPMPRVPL